MTRLEEDLRRWLADSAPLGGGFLLTRGSGKLLLELLAEPRLPAEPTPEMLLAMATGWKDDYRGAYRALYAHLTAPKPKLYRVLGHLLEIDDALKVARNSAQSGCKVTIEPEGT